MTLFATVIEALGIARRQPKDPSDISNHEFDSTPFWLLTIIFEQLILSPKPPDSNENIQPLIRRRINMFTQGRLKALYLEAQSIDNTRPPATPPKPRTASQRNRHAQMAADVDSFGVCAKRLTSDTPVAKVHTDKNHPDYNFPALKKLYPKCSYEWKRRHSNRRISRKRRHASNTKSFSVSPKSVAEHIDSLRRGKAPGIQVDSLDIFIELVARTKEEKLPPTTINHLTDIVTDIANSVVPP